MNTCPARRECKAECDPLQNPCWHHQKMIDEVKRLQGVLKTVRKAALVDQIDIAAFDAALTSIILITGNELKRGRIDAIIR